MKKALILFKIIALILIQYASGAPPEPTEKYANSIVLIQPDTYYLYWNYNKTDIVFEIHVKTTGWAGFGLSPNGGMDGSDVIVTWVDKSGKVYFTDRHIKGGQVLVDKTQNWNPIKVSSQSGYLVAKFTRKIKICDPTNEDRDIEPGTPYVIFSYGKSFVNGDITYHDGRGSKTLPLISSVNSKVVLDDENAETTDFRIDSIMDNQYETIYYCQVFKLPEKWTDVKQHLIAFETLYTPETKDNYHHWVVNLCTEDFETVYLKNNSFPEPGYCITDDHSYDYWNQIYAHCSKVSLVWAVGSSDIQTFPEDLGYAMGGKGYKYFVFQTHFNNPQKIPNLHDRSGVRFYTTTNYKKNEFDYFSVGTDENWDGLMIPPKAERFEANYGCSTECVDGFFDEHDEIKVFAAFPHTHLTGKEVYMSIIRDNKEVSYIAENRFYDFQYQYVNFLNEPIVLKKGDSLKVTCVYNTQKKENFTYIGFQTSNEMCAVVFMYYPRTEMSACIEFYNKDTLRPFFDGLAKDGDIKPVNITNSETLPITILNKNADLPNKFQNFYQNAERIQVCAKEKNSTVAVKKPPSAEPMQKAQCIPSQ